MNYPKKELLFFLYTFCIAVHTATLTISLPLIVSVLVITLPSSKEHDIKPFSNTQKETITFLLWEIMRHYGPPWHKSGWLNMLYFTMLLVSWKLTYLACQTQCGGWYIWHMGVSTAQQRYNMLRWHICHTSALGTKRKTSKWVQHIKRCRDRDIRCTLYGGLAGLELVSRTSLTRDDPIFFSTLTWGWRWQALSHTLSSEALQPLFWGPCGVTEHSVSESSPETVKGGLTPLLIHIS